MHRDNDPNGFPMGVPHTGPFQNLTAHQKKQASQRLEEHAVQQLKMMGKRRLQDPKSYVTNVIERVARDASFEYRGLGQLISYCKQCIHTAIIDDMRIAVRVRDEELTDHAIDSNYNQFHSANPNFIATTDMPKDPETEFIEGERRKLAAIKEREERIVKLLKKIKKECKPEQLATLEALLRASGQIDIYNEYKKGKRQGRLDLSPDNASQAAGIPIDTFNKHKRALKTIANRFGSFRRATSEWES